MTLFYPPLQNGLQKTLDAALDTAHTTALTLNNVTGIQNKPGVVVIDRIDSGGTEKSSSDREFVIYTGTSGNTLTGLTRAIGGSTDQDHAVGAVVEFVLDITWGQAIIDALTAEHGTDGTHDTTKVVDLATAQTLTNKTLTSPVLNTGVSGTAVLDEDDLATDSNTQVATQQSIKAYVDSSATAASGWTDPADTWTYASATTITVAAGAAAIYTKGDRIRLTQTTVKYWVIAAVADTLLTIIETDDYTLANAAISANYYSHADKPVGFPSRFSWTTTYGGFSADPTGKIEYTVSGGRVFIELMSGANISNATTFTCIVPVAEAFVVASYHSFPCMVQDNGTWQNAMGIIGLEGSDIRVGINSGTQSGNVYAGFTTSGNKGVQAAFSYPL